MELRENAFFKKAYEISRKTLTYVSPTLASKFIFRIAKGRRLDLNNPVLFDDKIMWLKLKKYYKNPIITQCVDKYAVRDYIKECGCEEILNDLIGVYDSSNEINWDELPDKFALKCNHGCGYNIICDDKSKLDIEKTKKQLDDWMKEDYYLNFAEVNYKYVPKKIICEKYLASKDGFLPNDYKIYCFDGVPKLVLTCYDRDDEKEQIQLVFTDLDFNILDYGAEGINDGRKIEKPESFDKMLEYCRKLSKGFPFVRMDFYDIDGKVFFGEMTFTPAGGLAKYYNDEGQKRLGEMISI
ncbi:ATP-grasp fold amidoligase family protein [Butyrivibrio sp. AE2015]|uniref:ATP-grasp fold amidoligase family protein n=1 Tax=Butyrivibrio sp. AE2015 TaxID=1280663 RepID=UPI0003B606D2|nr:ATP-grasp fold amidoligase family protein [Butyrivibrio sp. AE2015]